MPKREQISSRKLKTTKTDSQNKTLKQEKLEFEIMRLGLSLKKRKYGNNCAVPGCPSKDDAKLVFHTFPKKLEDRLRWLQVFKMSIVESRKKLLACQKHFKPSDYKEPSQKSKILAEFSGNLKFKKYLKEGVVPTEQIPSGEGNRTYINHFFSVRLANKLFFAKRV